MSSQPKALKDVLIDAYIAQGDDAGGENHWSWNVVYELLEAPPDVLWPILLELIARAPDRHLGYIAAGIVEDFLSRWGDRVIDAVETQANADARFRRVLRGVWKLGMTKEVYARVVAASRPEEGPLGFDGYRPNGEPLPTYRTELFVLTIKGLPPGVIEAELASARTRLLEELALAPNDVVVPFSGPVYLTISINLAPDITFPDTVAVTRAIVDALVPAGFSSPNDVWHIALRTSRDKVSSYRVEVVQMSDLQVSDRTDTTTLEPSSAVQATILTARRNPWISTAS